MRYYVGQIKEKFYTLDYSGVYDFIEILAMLDKNENYRDIFISQVKQVFSEEKVPYKIIDGTIIPLISEIEAQEVEAAINNDKYSIANVHLKKALNLYKKRPEPDYKNSIKESISAIEALARTVLNDSSATLGSLADKLNIHPALREAIKKLYGWTSDEGGIRHSEKNKELKTGEEEARYMLVQCSALFNYIVSKDK